MAKQQQAADLRTDADAEARYEAGRAAEGHEGAIELLRGLIGEMRSAGGSNKPIDAAEASGWGAALRWIADHMEADNATALASMRRAGWIDAAETATV